jgi:hypothetical protein
MSQPFTKRFPELRMLECVVIAALALAVIAYSSPQQLTVAVYKILLVTLFALLGFRLDRMIFPYARPDKVVDDARDWATMRRAVIIAASIIGGTIGV